MVVRLCGVEMLRLLKFGVLSNGVKINLQDQRGE